MSSYKGFAFTAKIDAQFESFLDFHSQFAGPFKSVYEASNTPVVYLAGKLGRPEAEINIFYCSIVGFVSCLLLSLVSNPTAKKILSTSLGIFINFFAYGTWGFLTLYYKFIAYACMRLLPRDV